MIEKECTFPITLIKLEALKQRFPIHHPKWNEIVVHYKKRLAGYRGEKSLDFHLSMLSDTRYMIFHNIRLPLGKYFFQIDILLLSRFFALVLETKNLAGEIIIEKEFSQAKQKIKDKIERIGNPVLQARLQAKKLKKWFQKHHIKDLPVHYLFVNSNEKTIITSEPGNEQLNRNMCNSEYLLEKITQVENYYKTESIDVKELRRIKRMLLADDTPENPDILKTYGISPNELPTGVQCTECGHFPMDHAHGTWHCPNCTAKSKTAHIKAVNDFFLLIKPTITNSELREFLHIDSISVASKILNSLDLPSTGTFRNRVYHCTEQYFKNLRTPMHKITPTYKK